MDIFQKSKYIFEKMTEMKSDVLKLFRTGIGAVDPYTCVKHHLVFKNDHLNNDDEKKELHLGDNHIVLNHNLYVAAFGKAALGTKKNLDLFLSIKYFLFFNKACVELWMNFVINILLKVLLVCLLVQLNKLKEMVFIHPGIVHLMFMKVLNIIYPIKQQWILLNVFKQ